MIPNLLQVTHVSNKLLLHWKKLTDPRVKGLIHRSWIGLKHYSRFFFSSSKVQHINPLQILWIDPFTLKINVHHLVPSNAAWQ